jgi:alpha-tubulin suppressor-like RCC1 family protein
MYDNHTIWFYGIRRVLSSYQYERYRSPTPRQMGSNKDWAAMEAGGYHDMALKAGGTLWVWGDNLYYQLGNAVSVYETNPIQVGTDTDWSEIFSAGVYHCTALKTDGSLWAWGNNTVGQLGDGTAVNKPEPVHILPGSTWKSVSAGMVHTLGIQTDGTLWAWGSNSNGQIGNGSLDDVLEPSRIGTDTDWVKVSAGWGFSAAIKADGSLWTWGNNRVGQLGIGSSDVWSFSPVPVPAQ